MSTKPDLLTALANVSSLLDLAQWHLLENAHRAGADLSLPYEVQRREGEQIMALLIVTDEYAKGILRAHDERASS